MFQHLNSLKVLLFKLFIFKESEPEDEDDDFEPEMAADEDEPEVKEEDIDDKPKVFCLCREPGTKWKLLQNWS